MIVCPSCGKTNGDGRRHCNWCGCYLPPLLHEDDAKVTARHNTWSNLSMLRVEQELIESELRRRLEQAEPQFRLAESDCRMIEELLEHGPWLWVE